MKQPFLYLCLILAIGLLIVEALLLSLMVDARTIPENGSLSLLLAEAGDFLRWLIVSAGLLALLLANGLKDRLAVLLCHYSLSPSLVALVVHLGLFVALVFVTQQVFDTQTGTGIYYSYLWLLVVGLSGVSWCLIIAGPANWRAFLTRERVSLAVALTGGFIIVAIGFYFQQFWGSMTDFTLGSTKRLLELFYEKIIFDASQNQLGVGAFWVYIAPVCSGIEGAVLAVSIAAIYLYLSRQYLKFPHALVLLPIAGILSIALNIVRITALIILGAEVSPALAIGGFHSIAGWITAILVALLIVFVFSSWQWIQKIPESKDATTTASTDSTLALAILIPFVIFAGASLVGSMFTGDFDYFYPVKVVLTSAAVLYFWKTYRFQASDRLMDALVVGILVAVLWVLLIPADDLVNTNVSAELAAMPLWALIGWSIFRLLGFWVLAPILEELVFRGYLLSRLSGQEISTTHKPAFSMHALLASAILFGLLHNAWLAGTAAGMLFAYVRYRTNSITSCIAAHATANVLVACWAAYSGNWSLI